MKSTEVQDTVRLANHILNRISADPDDDLAMLARQFLRARDALTWYANSANWDRGADAGGFWRRSKAMNDAGKLAQAALGNDPGVAETGGLIGGRLTGDLNAVKPR